MHFRVVFAWISEDVHQVTGRSMVSSRPVIHYCCYLHSAGCGEFCSAIAVFCGYKHIMYDVLAVRCYLEPAGLVLRRCEGLPPAVLAIAFLVCLCERNRDIIWHESALHKHPSLISYDVKDTDEWLR